MQVVKGNSDVITPYPDTIDRSLIVIIPHPVTGKLHKITVGNIIDMAGGSLSETIAFAASGNYTVINGKILEKILVQSDTDQTIRIGSTDGAGDILPDVPVLAGIPQIISLDLFAAGDKVIYISGFAGPLNITFYKR